MITYVKARLKERSTYYILTLLAVLLGFDITPEQERSVTVLFGLFAMLPDKTDKS